MGLRKLTEVLPPFLCRGVEDWEVEKVGLQDILCCRFGIGWPSSSVGRKSPWFVALTNNCKSPQQSREQVRMWFVPGGELPG